MCNICIGYTDFYIYNEKIQKAVYNYDLRYKLKFNNENSNNNNVNNKNKNITSKQNNRTRKRNIIWFIPPLCNRTVTNIDKFFLK